MRVLCVGIGMAIGFACPAQKWKHEALVTFDFKLDGAFAVNRSGSVIYSPWMPIDGGGDGRYPQAFKDRTNLTQKYLPPLSQGFASAINDAGQVAWRGLSPTSLTVMVDGHDYLAEVSPPLSTAYRVDVRGIDASGLPFWSVGKYGTGNTYRVYRGTEDLSAGITIYDPTLGHLNRNGDAVWSATIQTATGYEYDNFRNSDNISERVLGPVRALSSFKPDINDHGVMLWTGRGVNTNNKNTLFVDETPYYTDPGGAAPTAVHITNSGHVLWLKNYPNTLVVMRDQEDVSTPAFGDQPYTTYEGGIFMGESGDVIWTGIDMTSNYRSIYKNHRNLSAGLIGSMSQIGDQVHAVGIDDAGNALWWGAGTATNHIAHVFVNDFDLSADALGQFDSLNVRPLAIGHLGQVLWGANSPAGGTIYISSPVPEPSAVGVLFVLVLAGVLRRRQS